MADNKERRRKPKKERNWPYILPLVILALIAAAAYAWRQQQNQAQLEQSLASAATREARAEAATATATAEAALIAQVEPTAEPTLLPPTPTSTPTTAPTDVPTSTPTAQPVATATPELTATATSAPTATPVPTATPSPTPSPTATPVSAEISISRNQTTIRRGPAQAYDSLRFASAGETYEATGRSEGGNWLFICCIDGSEGWVSTSLVTTGSDLTALPIVRPPAAFGHVGTQQIPLYGGPGYGYEIVDFAPATAVLEITGQLPGGVWYNVCCGAEGQSGWVFEQTVRVDGPIEQIETVSAE